MNISLPKMINFFNKNLIGARKYGGFLEFVTVFVDLSRICKRAFLAPGDPFDEGKPF